MQQALAAERSPLALPPAPLKRLPSARPAAWSAAHHGLLNVMNLLPLFLSAAHHGDPRPDRKGVDRGAEAGGVAVLVLN